jgi:hypothetical protein
MTITKILFLFAGLTWAGVSAGLWCLLRMSQYRERVERDALSRRRYDRVRMGAEPWR